MSDYLEQDESLGSFYGKFPTIEGIKEQLEEKQKSVTQKGRSVLVSQLQEQYTGVAITQATQDNINALSKDTAFTITTGHQLNLFSGPMYYIYKILSVINLTEQLAKKYPENSFVPVFWMATEDHDLQEIQSINVYNQSFTWDTTQTGAVGRMNTAGISELFDELKTKMNLSEAQLRFIEASQMAYGQSSNLSSAFRTLLHTYFSEQGLVIIDADSENLKKEFIPVLKDELKGLNYESLLISTLALEKEGFQRQLVIRECNLFKLGEHQREKHNVMNDEEDVLDQYVKQNVFNLSPNAALRPLYQEWILPNLVYVGGASEVNYWTQLKGLFDNYEIPVPIVHLRTSNIIIPEQLLHESTDVDVTDFFKSDQSLISTVNKEQDKLFHTMRQNFEDLKNHVYAHQKLVENNLTGFNLDAKVSKMIEKLDEINKGKWR